MHSNKLNMGLIFFVFGIIFLATTIAAPPPKSEEEFIEDAEEHGALEQEVDLDDDEIYGEDAIDEFRKQHPSHGDDDVEDFEVHERPPPGGDLVQGNHGQDNHQDKEESERSVEDFERDLSGKESESEAGAEAEGVGEDLGEYNYEDDDELYNDYSYEDWYGPDGDDDNFGLGEDDEDEDWYGPDDTDENNSQDANAEAFGVAEGNKGKEKEQ